MDAGFARVGKNLVLPLVLLATAALAVAGAVLGGVHPRQRPRALTNIRFTQLDWHTPDGAVLRHTRWVAFSYSYRPRRHRTRYLNLVTSSSNPRGAWVIQNLPLFESHQKRVRATTYFDLQELGLTAGQFVGSICYRVSLDDHLRKKPPQTALNCVTVESEDYVAGDDESLALPDNLGFNPGGPAPMKFQETPTKLGGGRRQAVRGVQEEEKQCMAGAIARSLDWLNREYKLGFKQDPQDFYKQLVKAGVTRTGDPGDDPAMTEGARLAVKQKYVDEKLGGKIETKTWDPGGNLDTPKGIAESDEDFGKWLQSEWPTEDVELAWRTEKFAHIVTLTEVAVNQDGSFKVRYREDGLQGDFNGGDRVVKDGKIFRKSGKWYFNNENLELHFAVSESVKTPAPTTTTSSTSTSTTSTTTSVPTSTTTIVSTTTTSVGSTTTTAPTTSTTTTSVGSTTTTSVPPAADLDLRKSGPPVVVRDTSFDYMLTVGNNGPSPASVVVLRDSLPDGVTVLAFQGPCILAGPMVLCSLGTIDVGQLRVVTIRVRASTLGTIVNTASVASAEPDPDPSNNSSSLPTLVVPPVN